jgi:hypothetical protein
MVPDSRLEVEFFRFLEVWDEELARQVAAARCRHCGGPLHQANYQRKPRGGRLAEGGEACQVRHSLCCGWRGCRRRALPPSLRFLGRRVYLEAVVVLAGVLVQLTATVRQARIASGVPTRTLRRWGVWWSAVFPSTRTWREAKARFAPPPPQDSELPYSLVARLSRELTSGTSIAQPGGVCLLAARLLAPVTTASVADGAYFVRAAAQHLAATSVTQKMAF